MLRTLVRLTVLACFGLVYADCRGAGESEMIDPYKCLNSDQLPSDSVKMPEAIGSVSSPLYAIKSTFWRRADHQIPVCWEADSFGDGDASYRASAQAAVERNWGRALAFPAVKPEKQYRITGWGKCEDKSEGIRIQLNHDPNFRAFTNGHGTELAGVRNGMELRNVSPCTAATFHWPADTNPDYVKKSCDGVYGTKDVLAAIHEFGHALGLLHEQKRLDTPKECLDTPEIKNDPSPYANTPGGGDLTIGPWDVDSIMNYCAYNPKFNPHPPTGLSIWDELGLRAAYYPELFNFNCVADAKQGTAAAQAMPIHQNTGINSTVVTKTLPEDVAKEALKPAAGTGR